MRSHQHSLLFTVAVSGLLTYVPHARADIALTQIGHGEKLFPVPHDVDRAGLVTPISVTGVPSFDYIDSPNNAVMWIQVGAGNGVNGIGWDVVLQTLHPSSLLSDILVAVTDSTGLGGFSLRPGFTDQTPGGPSSYDSDGQILKLANYSIPDIIAMGDGLIRLEFFDFYDDAIGVADAEWLSGSLFLQTYAPIPNASAASLLVLAGIARLGRRRKARIEDFDGDVDFDDADFTADRVGTTCPCNSCGSRYWCPGDVDCSGSVTQVDVDLVLESANFGHSCNWHDPDYPSNPDCSLADPNCPDPGCNTSP